MGNYIVGRLSARTLRIVAFSANVEQSIIYIIALFYFIISNDIGGTEM